MIWSLKELRGNMPQAEINGEWVPARPLNWKYRTFIERLKEAWAVFSGRCEAFTWPEDENGSD